jgi:hypothetical protein
VHDFGPITSHDLGTRLGRWRQTTYTELSLASNEALFVATMIRQSSPTARLRGLKRIQNRKLWRE